MISNSNSEEKIFLPPVKKFSIIENDSDVTVAGIKGQIHGH